MTRARHDAALSQEATRASDEQCRATPRHAAPRLGSRGLAPARERRAAALPVLRRGHGGEVPLPV